MAQLNDLLVTGAARFINSISGTADKAVCDGNGSNIASTYMKKGVDYVTAGQVSGTTPGNGSTVEGYNNNASGAFYAHVEGENNTATTSYIHVEGSDNQAGQYASHAEGWHTQAYGTYGAHTEGYYTLVYSKSNSYGAHAEGQGSSVDKATAYGPHAEGYYTQSNGSYGTHVQGFRTISSYDNQFVTGKYNVDDDNCVFIIGNGTSTSDRKNVFTVSRKGMITLGYTNGIVPSTYQAASNTVPNLINELRVLNGAMGSVYLTSAYTLSSITISAGWYCYLYVPYGGTGGVDGSASGGSGTDSGALILFGMNSYNKAYFVRYYSGSIIGIRTIV